MMGRRTALGLVCLLAAPLAGCNPPAANGPPPGSVRVAPGVYYTLEDGVARHREYPDTFTIPTRPEREALQPGQRVKLMFQILALDEPQVERMWVRVTRREGAGYVGTLANRPYATNQMAPGMEVHFRPEHVIDVRPAEDGGR